MTDARSKINFYSINSLAYWSIALYFQTKTTNKRPKTTVTQEVGLGFVHQILLGERDEARNDERREGVSKEV